MSAGDWPTRTPTFELRRITAGYGRSIVLHDIDLDVPAGSVVGALAPARL